MKSPANKSAFTGRKRNLRNRASVRWADAVARGVITLGGVGTIAAVSTVCIFLLWVVVPLFRSASAGDAKSVPVSSGGEPIHLGVDDYKTMAWTLERDGSIRVIRLDTGEVLATSRVVPDLGPALTCANVGWNGELALGFADGSVRLGSIRWKSSFPRAADLAPDVARLGPGELAAYDGGLLQRTGQGELRYQKIDVEINEPVQISASPISLIDHVVGPQGPIFAALTGDNKLHLSTVRQKQNLLTGETTLKAQDTTLPYVPWTESPAKFLRLAGLGDNVTLAWADGHVIRFDTRDLEHPVVAERRDLVSEPQAELTRLDYLLGRSTLIAGDSTGGLRAWFRTRPDDAVEAESLVDGTRLVATPPLSENKAGVTSLAMSSRGRSVVAGHADGSLRVYYVTTGNELLETQVADGARLDAVAIAPKEDALVALGGGRLWRADFDKAHPEATLASLFLPVWYEGYAAPDHVWQSGGGSEDFEPKLGLWPLVFGTLKATFFSLLIGVPLAILAAIYTSEFLSENVRAKVKPTIELMASLPSVVLGFLAALVLAPFVERSIGAILTSLVTVPIAILFGAHVWQLLPTEIRLRYERWRVVGIGLALPMGILGAAFLAPWIESWFFAGDLIAWLDGRTGRPWGGWMFLFLPLAGFATVLALGLSINPRLRTLTLAWDRKAVARLGIAKFFLATLVTVGLAFAASLALDVAGFDARGLFLGTYVQRNALVVGFVMGVAVVPIIYTIADDALHTVPKHLRSGSLGAGATPWQTTIRIVIPAAMSGLFSAVMVGLGRAVGETMIVLMAAGNTAIRDWNPFNGFRTLSANIAVELPEAARDSTHYRTLFLAALTLFALTFAVNTIAEMIRIRFRRRAVQL